MSHKKWGIPVIVLLIVTGGVVLGLRNRSPSEEDLKTALRDYFFREVPFFETFVSKEQVKERASVLLKKRAASFENCTVVYARGLKYSKEERVWRIMCRLLHSPDTSDTGFATVMDSVSGLYICTIYRDEEGKFLIKECKKIR